MFFGYFCRLLRAHVHERLHRCKEKENEKDFKDNEDTALCDSCDCRIGSHAPIVGIRTYDTAHCCPQGMQRHTRKERFHGKHEQFHALLPFRIEHIGT